MAGQTMASEGTSVPTESQKKEPMIKSKGVAALVSLFLPGVGLALCNPSRVVEGAAVFIVALALDALAVLVSVGGPIAGQIIGATTGCCILNLLSFGLILGIVLIPVIHILAALHTYMRA